MIAITKNILEDVYSIPKEEEKNLENGGYLGVSKSCLYKLTPKEVLTSDEAAEYLGISKSCLYKLTMGRKIPHYKSQGGKLCYFDRQEIIAWMKANRVATQEELEAKAMEIAKKGGKR